MPVEAGIVLIKYSIMISFLGVTMGFFITKFTMYATPLIILHTLLAPLAGVEAEWGRVLAAIASIPDTLAVHSVEFANEVYINALAYGGIDGVVYVLITMYFVAIFAFTFASGVYAGLVIPLLSLFF